MPSVLSSFLLAATLAGCPQPSSIPDGGPSDGGVDPRRMPVAALAGPDLVVLEGQRVQLFGRASRSTDGVVRYAWQQTDGPPVLLTNPTTATPVFVAPPSPATLIFSLQIQDGAGRRDTDEVWVKTAAAPGPLPALATLGPDRAVQPGDTAVVNVAFPAGRPVGGLTYDVTLRCGDGAHPVDISGDALSLVVPATLPCVVVVDGAPGDGPRIAPAATVLWPEGTPLLSPTTSNVVALASAGSTVQIEPLTPLSADATFEVAVASATPLDVSPLEGGGATLLLPREVAPVIVSAMQRSGAQSGGMTYARIRVTAGSDNTAPTVNAGPDRLVAPGASFGLAVTGDDADGDVLTFTTSQVYGPSAAEQGTGFTFVAPDEAALLLFHVRADDGIAQSASDVVRVQVSDDVENLPPVIVQNAIRYVIPGAPFVLDGTGASDPDSGFIAQTVISQSTDDAFILLPESITNAAATLTAGADGEAYHFIIEVFDAEGASAQQSVAVFVEDAGRNVDPTRGDDATGNGTYAAPFATVSGAFDTAARHAFDVLHLAANTPHGISGELPEGLGLVGGFVADAATQTYLPTGPPSTVLVENQGISLQDASAIALDVQFAPGSTGGLTLSGDCSFIDGSLSEAPGREGPLLTISDGGTAAVLNVSVTGAASPLASRTSVHVGSAASARFTDVTVIPGAGARRTAMECTGGDVRVRTSTLGDALGVDDVAALRADACLVDIRDSILIGGAAKVATGIVAHNTVMSLGPGQVVGASGPSTTARGIRATFDNDDVLLVQSEVHAVQPGLAPLPDDAVALETTGGVIELLGATLSAESTEDASALFVSRGRVDVLDSQLSATAPQATAMLAAQSVALVVHDSTLNATGDAARALACDQTLGAQSFIQSCTFVVAGQTTAEGIISAQDAFRVDTSDILVTAASGSASGIDARGVVLRDSNVRAGATLVASALVASDPTVVLDVARSVVAANAPTGDAFALRASGDVKLASAFVDASGLVSVGLSDAKSIDLLNATIRAESVAVDASAALSVGATNTAFVAPTIFSQVDPEVPFNVDHAAVDSSLFVTMSDGPTLDLPAAESAGRCVQCFSFGAPAFDDDGRLVADSPLIDTGSSESFDAVDIDGDVRPEGLGPDIGCDEWTPAEQ